jgi:hypothetical protein
VTRVRRRTLGLTTVVLLLAGCSGASEPPPPLSWQDYGTLTALRDDAALVVTGVAQRQDGDDAPLVQFSVTETLAGTAPAEDPVRVRLDRSAPLDLVPGFRYVLYLVPEISDDGTNDTFTVVGPGAFEQPPGSATFTRLDAAPESLPENVSVRDVTES